MNMPPFSEITDESQQSASSSLNQKVVFTERDRRLVVNNNNGRGGGGTRGEMKGSWTLYDGSNNLVRQDWSNMINRSLRTFSDNNGGTEYTDNQAGLNRLLPKYFFCKTENGPFHNIQDP